MTGQHAQISLTGVSETLLIPLAVRYRDNQDAHPFLPDPMVITVMDRLQLDLSKFLPAPSNFIGVVARGNIIDAAVNRFVADHPDATIINLGAGLCTRYERLKSRPAHWIDIDFPQVEPYWQTAFAPDTKRRFIAASVTDPALWQQLGEEVSKPVMVIAEGLMMYLTESDVRMILSEISQRFPGAEILLEVVSPFFAKRPQRLPGLSKTLVRFNWGLKTGAELESWGVGARVLAEWRIMDWRPADNRPLPKVSFFFKIIWMLPMLKNGFRIIHLRLGPGE